MSAPKNPPPFYVHILTAGTAACIADIGTFPLDTAKVRLQVQGEAKPVLNVNNPAAMPVNGSTSVTPHYRGTFGTLYGICKHEGFGSMYKGIVPGMQRQICFSSVRIGLYDSVKTYYQQLLGVDPTGLNIPVRVAAGITTGGAAVLFAQPTDVVKVRMQASIGKSGKYKGVVQSYLRISREEGVKGLWKGTIPNVSRNAIVNVAEIVCYDVIKDTLLMYKLMDDTIKCHFVSAFSAGFCATVVASPVDVVKTRYMNSAKGTYSGAGECALRMFREEGSAAFYKGFIPSFTRIVGWNIGMWLTYEQLKKVIITKDFRPYHRKDFTIQDNARMQYRIDKWMQYMSDDRIL